LKEHRRLLADTTRPVNSGVGLRIDRFDSL
jgi:hypothetical protein